MEQRIEIKSDSTEIEIRDKDEITRDIEQSRREVKEALQATKHAWVERNPAVLAWRATRDKAEVVKLKTAAKARATDDKVRSNIYKSLGIAAGVGLLAGFIFRWRAQRAKRCC